MENNQYQEIFQKFRGNQGDLISILHQVQSNFGYVSQDAVQNISSFLKISENQIYGVASFYSQFRFVEQGKCIIKICMGTACHVRGSKNILEEFKRWLNIEEGETTEDKMFTLETVNCVGACALGPIAIFDNDYHGQLKIKTVEELIQKYQTEIESEESE